jgi:GST-like protein
MIELYYWPTSNGHKITIFVEEAAVSYQIKPVNISKGDQFKPEFLAISPNNRMPAIIDTQPADGGPPVSVFESGAVLIYLAEKFGKFCPTDLRGRKAVYEWLFWQVGGLGPMAGQRGHFSRHAPGMSDYALDRYTKEVDRLQGVMERQLGKHEFLAGAYSIADMACYPWINSGVKRYGGSLEAFPNLARWYKAIGSRPAVVKAYNVGKQFEGQRASADEAAKVLYGQTASSVAKMSGA